MVYVKRIFGKDGGVCASKTWLSDLRHSVRKFFSLLIERRWSLPTYIV
jgi:hypothetical protein